MPVYPICNVLEHILLPLKGYSRVDLSHPDLWDRFFYERKEMKSLNEIYSQFPDSDKGTVHTYMDFYETALEPYRNTRNCVMEIGVKEGGSIRMWSEYFPHAEIIGVDIVDPPGEYSEATIVVGDATRAETFEYLDNFDVIIDDGSHRLQDQLATFRLLWPKLNPGGVYLIEDIHDLEWVRHHFEALAPNVVIHDWRREKNRADDIIIEIRK